MTSSGRAEQMRLSYAPLHYTVEEYLALERASEERHEYLDGQIYAMAGESLAHGDICSNLVIEIGAPLRGRPCRVLAKDTKVRSGPTNVYDRVIFPAEVQELADEA